MDRDPARRDDGSVLLLMPLAVLIMIMLMAIAVDFATVFLGQRRASDLAAGIANDAIASVHVETFYDTGGTVVFEGPVIDARIAELAVQAGNDAALRDVACDWDAVDDTVTVHCTARVEPIFISAFPWAPQTFSVEATERAFADRG